MSDYEQNKTETIIIRVPVKTYYEKEMDYYQFVKYWADLQMKGESDDDYERRCVRMWSYLVDDHGDQYECQEIDEDGMGNPVLHILEHYTDAADEWAETVKEVAALVKEHMKEEAKKVLETLAPEVPAPKTLQEEKAELEKEVARLKALLGDRA